MNVNDIVTLLCSGGFAACLVGILSIRSQLRQQAAAADKADTATVRKVEATDERSYKQGFTTAEWAFMAAAWLITFVILYIIQKRIWTKQY
jgi:type VI protein secretion system component VasF